MVFRCPRVSIEANRDHLTQLDAAIGDADHGVNMSRGFSEMAATINRANSALCTWGPFDPRPGERFVSRRRWG